MTQEQKAIRHVQGHDFQGNPVKELITRPDQLSLFQDLLAPGTSSTIELFDAMPKTFASNKEMNALREKNGGQYLDTLVRNFVFRNEPYQLTIRPARIREKTGLEKEYYPTHGADLIEQALRNLATRPENGIYLGGSLAVQFALSEARRELEEIGHGMSYSSLKQGLEINNRVHTSLNGPDGKPVVSSPIFPVFIHADRQQWEENPSQAKCYVKFHPLVTLSVEELTNRQLDYKRMMKLKYVLSYYLFKRISHLYTYADYNKPYHIKLSTLVRDSGMTSSHNPSDNLKRVRKTLQEFIEKQVILDFDEEITRGPNNRIVEVTFNLYPFPDFKEHAIKANFQQQRARDIVTATKEELVN